MPICDSRLCDVFLSFPSNGLLVTKLLTCSDAHKLREMNFKFDGSKVFFTSDTHFYHGNIIRFCNRPFKDVDMMNELTKYLGTEDAPYEIEWVEMSFEMIISSVQLGQVDIGVAGFTYDPERQVLFSDPYLESAQVIIVKSDSGIETTEDLNGKLIGVQAGTTGESAAGNIEGATLNSVTDAQLLVESLNAGSIDAMVADKAVAENYVNNIEGLTILEEPLIDEENCIITAEGKDALMEKINEAIAQFNESDAQQQLKEKWGL